MHCFFKLLKGQAPVCFISLLADWFGKVLVCIR